MSAATHKIGYIFAKTCLFDYKMPFMHIWHLMSITDIALLWSYWKTNWCPFIVSKGYCTVVCDWFIAQPMRWPVTFKIKCGLQTLNSHDTFFFILIIEAKSVLCTINNPIGTLLVS